MPTKKRDTRRKSGASEIPLPLRVGDKKVGFAIEVQCRRR